MENEKTTPQGSTSEGSKANKGLTEMTLDSLPANLKQACDRAGWDKLMPVQSRAIPYLLAGKDIMVQARTGSGKTGAFVLPLIDKLDPTRPQCQALVMVPTRELASQVAAVASMLAGENGIKDVAVYGGVGHKQQLDAFRDGAQLVVGTPGRILDHLVRRNLVLDDLKVLIFDEADRMLSVGFYPDMVEVKRYLPRDLVGSFMFSATFPQSVLRLAEEFMHKPELISLSSDEENITSIAHQFVEVQAMGKERKLIKFIELENPSSALIFCNTKRNVEFTAALLSQFGFDAEGLTSDLTQNRREKLMAQIKAGNLRFLVATDVAARGIDIPDLSHVFMMEPPEDPESYVHRAGRTGRAGATGTAITMVDVIQKMELERIAARFNIKFEEIKDPTDEDVSAIMEERLTALLEKKYRKLTNLQKERVARFLPLARKYGEDEDTLALLAMLLDELYQPTLHGKPVEPAVKKGDADRSRPKQARPAGRKPKKGNSDRKPEKRQKDVTEHKAATRPEHGKQTPHKAVPGPERGDQAPQEAAPKPPAPASEGKPKPKPRPRRRRRKRKPSGS